MSLARRKMGTGSAFQKNGRWYACLPETGDRRQYVPGSFGSREEAIIGLDSFVRHGRASTGRRVCCVCKDEKAPQCFRWLRDRRSLQCIACSRQLDAIPRQLRLLRAPIERDGMSTAEVAAALGISAARVNQIEQSAMRKLRRRAKRLGINA